MACGTYLKGKLVDKAVANLSLLAKIDITDSECFKAIGKCELLEELELVDPEVLNNIRLGLEKKIGENNVSV